MVTKHVEVVLCYRLEIGGHLCNGHHVLNTPSDTARRNRLYNVSGGNILNLVVNYAGTTVSAGFAGVTSMRRLQLSLRYQF